MVSTGKYAVKNRGTFTDSGKPEFLIFKLSEDQKLKYLNQIPKPRSSESFKEGEEFKGFKVTDIAGNKFDLREAKGKVIVLNFWFINCSPCKQEIPELNELLAEYKDHPNVIFLGIALDEKSAIKEFIKNTAFNYNLVDGRPIANKYGVKLYPTHVVIDQDNKIKFSTVGLAANTIYWIKKAIDESLASN
jgi:thiol-disulfide isomerase/thioredoxin